MEPVDSYFLMQIQDKNEKSFYIHDRLNLIREDFAFLDSHSVESFSK